MAVELGAIPFTYLVSAVVVALLYTYLTKRMAAVDAAAIVGALAGLMLNVKLFTHVNSIGIAVYRLGGFPPPLGVIYVADSASSILALLASFALLLSTLFSTWSMEPGVRALYYVLSLLLAAGVHGCLFTGDVFNFYVSIELVAIASYAITGIYREKPRVVRAAIIYGIAGTIVTSFLLLAVFMIYGSYGTLNMADIAVKAVDPGIEVELSGSVYGDIVFISKVSLALITWVLLFKSGVMPNHFWLPEAYRAAPLPAIALFTSSADVIGVYGLIRLYYTVFSEDIVVRDFRNTLLALLMLMGGISTVISALFVSRQTSIRRLVAYSSISQFSLALLGVAAGVSEAVAGAILHLVANGLGDMAVVFGASTIKHMARRGCIKRSIALISYIALTIGLLNLFGIVPFLPGFWSKTYLAMGFIKAGLPQGAAVVLVSTGLCALGYLRTLIKYLSLAKSPACSSNTAKVKELAIPLAVLIAVIAAATALGIAFIISSAVRDALVLYGSTVMDSGRYVEKVFSST